MHLLSLSAQHAYSNCSSELANLLYSIHCVSQGCLHKSLARCEHADCNDDDDKTARVTRMGSQRNRPRLPARRDSVRVSDTEYRTRANLVCVHQKDGRHGLNQALLALRAKRVVVAASVQERQQHIHREPVDTTCLPANAKKDKACQSDANTFRMLCGDNSCRGNCRF